MRPPRFPGQANCRHCREFPASQPALPHRHDRRHGPRPGSSPRSCPPRCHVLSTVRRRIQSRHRRNCPRRANKSPSGRRLLPWKNSRAAISVSRGCASNAASSRPIGPAHRERISIWRSGIMHVSWLLRGQALRGTPKRRETRAVAQSQSPFAARDMSQLNPPAAGT